MKLIAQILSVLFHPLLVPVFALLQMNFLPFFYPGADSLRHVLIFGSMFVLVVPPTIWYFLLYKLKVIKSWKATTRKERIWPYLFTILSYILVSVICYFLDVDYGFSQLWQGATIALLVVFIVNFFWKISAHATGMGSWTGMLIFLSIYNGYFLLFQIIVVILSSGLIGWSRLKLEAHTPQQVFFGYLLGLICVGFLPFLIFL